MKHALIIIAHSFIGTKLLHGQRKSIISCSDVFAQNQAHYGTKLVIYSGYWQ